MIDKFQQVTAVIHERRGRNDKEFLFPGAEYGSDVIGVLPLSPAAAQRLKPRLRTAFVVAPKEPHLDMGSHVPMKVTLDVALDVQEHFVILMTDIRCGLLMDETGRFLAAYATN